MAYLILYRVARRDTFFFILDLTGTGKKDLIFKGK